MAASPDGVVVPLDEGEQGLLEIKNLLQADKRSFEEAARDKKDFCLSLNSGQLHLKNEHPYFYQVHGLLNVCKMPWLDFVVRRTNPHQMHVERIHRDIVLWERMLPKLKAFYVKCLLPELASPREGKHPGIREPGIWVRILHDTYSTRHTVAIL
jgi:hypothetical protein